MLDKQKAFSQWAGKLIQKAFEMGYEVTLGEAWRTPEQAKIYADQGIGIPNSLHCRRLAIDLNIFKDGVLLKMGAGFTDLGEWWEANSNEYLQFCWGGRFNDGNHFSIGDGNEK